jgi:hypothetical protein
MGAQADRRPLIGHSASPRRLLAKDCYRDGINPLDRAENRLSTLLAKSNPVRKERDLIGEARANEHPKLASCLRVFSAAHTLTALPIAVKEF